MENSDLSTSSAGTNSQTLYSLMWLPVQPLHQHSCQFSTVVAGLCLSSSWDSGICITLTLFGLWTLLQKHFLSWLLGFLLIVLIFFLYVMNDGLNRVAAENIQNGLLASQEFAVMCYTSLRVLEPEQKSKLSPAMGGFVSGWAQPCRVKGFIMVIVVITVKFMLMAGDNDKCSSLCVKCRSGCCPHWCHTVL